MKPPRTPARSRQRGWAWLSWAVPAAAKVAGDVLGMNQARKANAMQWELATKGLQYRAADARAAGLHPLAALQGGMPQINPAIATFTGMQSAGQDLGRAFLANADDKERDAYARKETSQFGARLASNQMALSDMEVEAARLRLNRLQQEVQNDAQGFSIKPNEVTASNPSIPSVAAGPAGPGFKATRIGNSTWDIGTSELSEWAEGAGLAGHGLVPFWMWEQAKARAMQERLDTDNALRGKDPAYTAAVNEARASGGYVERYRHPDGHYGWAVLPKYSSKFTPDRVKPNSLPDGTVLYDRGLSHDLPEYYNQRAWRGEGWVPRRGNFSYHPRYEISPRGHALRR